MARCCPRRASEAPRCESRWITAFLKVPEGAQGRLPREIFGSDPLVEWPDQCLCEFANAGYGGKFRVATDLSAICNGGRAVRVLCRDRIVEERLGVFVKSTCCRSRPFEWSLEVGKEEPGKAGGRGGNIHDISLCAPELKITPPWPRPRQLALVRADLHLPANQRRDLGLMLLSVAIRAA
jgi:hypothetical protein